MPGQWRTGGGLVVLLVVKVVPPSGWVQPEFTLRRVIKWTCHPLTAPWRPQGLAFSMPDPTTLDLTLAGPNKPSEYPSISDIDDAETAVKTRHKKSSKKSSKRVKQESSQWSKCTKAVVIDMGTGILKAGLSAATEPSCVIPSHCPLYYKRGLVWSDFVDSLDSPHINTVHNGVITEWDSVEKLWEYTFKTMGVSCEEHAVLVCDAPLSPTTNREKLAEVMFENFSCPSLFVENQAVLSMYSYGRTSGLVLECGHGGSYAVPISEDGYSLNDTCRVEHAGRTLDLHLQQLLQKTGKDGPWDKLSVLRDIKAKCCYISTDTVNVMSQQEGDEMEYQLPDGNSICLRNERFLCPEALFQPCLLESKEPGLHTMVMNCIQKCDVSQKDTLLENILICGGSTMLPGFAERLQNELFHMAPRSGALVLASHKRQNAAWLGGSILASLSSFQSLWISRKEYEEKGPSVMYQQC
ncbi:uncharacterized protein FYW47_000585 [Aplochiton taeniatus]